jgi:hypothetical protein
MRLTFGKSSGCSVSICMLPPSFRLAFGWRYYVWGLDG